MLHAVDDEDGAWQRLRIQAATGQPFYDVARIKITLIEAVPRYERAPVAAIWDQCQAGLKQ